MREARARGRNPPRRHHAQCRSADSLSVALPARSRGYVFPDEYLAYRTRKRQAELLRELPDFLALVSAARPPKSGLEHAVRRGLGRPTRASGGQHLLAEQVCAAIRAAYGFGSDLFDALRDIATAADLEALDELAASLGSSRRLGKGGLRGAPPSTSARCATTNETALWARPRWSAQARCNPRGHLPARVRAARDAPLFIGPLEGSKEVIVSICEEACSPRSANMAGYARRAGPDDARIHHRRRGDPGRSRRRGDGLEQTDLRTRSINSSSSSWES